MSLWFWKRSWAIYLLSHRRIKSTPGKEQPVARLDVVSIARHHVWKGSSLESGRPAARLTGEDHVALLHEDALVGFVAFGGWTCATLDLLFLNFKISDWLEILAPVFLKEMRQTRFDESDYLRPVFLSRVGYCVPGGSVHSYVVHALPPCFSACCTEAYDRKRAFVCFTTGPSILKSIRYYKKRRKKSVKSALFSVSFWQSRLL